MTKLGLLGTAAIILSSALAGPAIAQQVIDNPARCAAVFPNANCKNLGPGNPYTGNRYRSQVAYRHRADPTAYTNWNDPHDSWNSSGWNNGWHNDVWHGGGWNNSWNDNGWNGSWNNGWRDDRRARSGFWPGDVAAGVVGGAIGTAKAAVGTAGAIATAPFRENSYAHDNGGGYYNNAWDRRTFAQRNGFVCQPGTWYKGGDGRRHICQ